MRKSLFLMAMLCSCYYGYSQTKLTFSYDAAGNQTQRCYGCSGAKSDSDLENLENNISLVPNPTSGRLTLLLKGEAAQQVKNVTVYSTLGREVQKLTLDEFSAETQLNVSKQPTGMYLVQIGLNDGSLITKRIIKH